MTFARVQKAADGSVCKLWHRCTHGRIELMRGHRLIYLWGHFSHCYEGKMEKR